MKLSSIIACATLVLLTTVNVQAYTVSFGRDFPFGYGSKSYEIANKASYERVLKLKDLIIQNLKEQDTVSRNDKDGSGYDTFIRLRRQNREYFNELDSILGVRR